MVRNLSEIRDDLYLRSLRTASNALDTLGSLASGRNDFAGANRFWAMQSEIDNLRRDAREAGMRYLGSLPPDKG